MDPEVVEVVINDHLEVLGSATVQQVEELMLEEEVWDQSEQVKEWGSDLVVKD